MTAQLLIEKLPYLKDSEIIFRRLKALPNRVWLDSGKPASNYGRFDIISAAPKTILKNPSIVEVESKVQALGKNIDFNGLVEYDLPFWCGAIGYFNYEYNHSEFDLPQKKSQLADSYVGFFEWVVIQDHEKQQCYFISLPTLEPENAEEYKKIVRSPFVSDNDKNENGNHKGFNVKELNADFSFSHYEQALAEIKKYISAGDTYQINFSQRFSGIFSGSAESCYLKLRKALPSPFSSFLELGDESILSFSPERFIDIHKRFAVTQPIKGTAPRGKTINEDLALANELLNSEKNRAENLMIVDLLRNDFNKNCKPFSVQTSKLFSLESFANVHHLVSTVQGKLNPEVTPLQFFYECFPGGSITGTPKKRSMEIIYELEQHPRNIYCGSIFYLDIRDNFDSNIAIRTVMINKNEVFCWGGGGVVYDSNTQEEYQESLQKIHVLLNALSD